MKKLIILICILIPHFLIANPIILGVPFSEIYFDNSGIWSIEITSHNMTSIEYIDSIQIECISGIATVMYLDTVYGYMTITNDNLNNNLTFNKDYDFIKIHSYTFGYQKTYSVRIGDYPESYLRNINYGQSISCIVSWIFYKDNSPTMGFENDFEGAIGKIYGYFYDLNGEPIRNKYFNIEEGYSNHIQEYPYYIEINNEGFYCAEITSRSYSICERLIFETPSDTLLMNFDTVNFELFENDSLHIDFRRVLCSIENIFPKKVMLLNYPNPASEKTYILFDSNCLKLQSLLVSIYNVNGQLIDSFIPQTSQIEYNCENLKKGTYIYTLSNANKILNSQKLYIM